MSGWGDKPSEEPNLAPLVPVKTQDFIGTPIGWGAWNLLLTVRCDVAICGARQAMATGQGEVLTIRGRFPKDAVSGSKLA